VPFPRTTGRLTRPPETGNIDRVSEPPDYRWLFDDLRSDPGDSLSREQYRTVLTRLASTLAGLPEGDISEEALSDVDQYILRLWWAINGEGSSIEGIQGHDGYIVDAYRIQCELYDRDCPLNAQQRRVAMTSLRKVLDDLVATAL
jgi:hypothetical protein